NISAITMKRVLVCAGILAVASAGALRAQEKAAKPALMQPGLLNKLQPQLEQIFQFTFDGARLKSDRKGWGEPPTHGPKANINFAVNAPPIENIFNLMRNQAGGLQSSSMSLSNRHRE